ncbi:MAG TPA: hypothetical protein VEN79_12265 [Terriglobia bacterium]|nr:hypothetical protein [Terriglobia bacterium]
MTSGIPVDLLEKRAADQRRDLHNSVIELRQTVKEKLDIKRNVRDYAWPAAGVMAVVGLVLGYAFAGIVVGHRR